MIEYIILGLLYAKAKSGYDIKKIMEENIGMFYKASNGSIYPALRKLENKGWIERCIESAGHREKKIYQITKVGQIAFLDWVKVPISYNAGNMQECVKVFFFDFLEEAERDQALSRLEDEVKQNLEELLQLKNEYSQEADMMKRYYRMSTLYYGISISKETLRWCQHIREKKELKNLI
ncbi:MAG: PadR family transcriptional regulator [Cellulosilyticum sp.]|nr:PadR family transcriptional regulator [Cellulosilyticum sp.]